MGLAVRVIHSYADGKQHHTFGALLLPRDSCRLKLDATRKPGSKSVDSLVSTVSSLSGQAPPKSALLPAGTVYWSGCRWARLPKEGSSCKLFC